MVLRAPRFEWILRVAAHEVVNDDIKKANAESSKRSS